MVFTSFCVYPNAQHSIEILQFREQKARKFVSRTATKNLFPKRQKAAVANDWQQETMTIRFAVIALWRSQYILRRNKPATFVTKTTSIIAFKGTIQAIHSKSTDPRERDATFRFGSTSRDTATKVVAMPSNRLFSKVFVSQIEQEEGMHDFCDTFN